MHINKTTASAVAVAASLGLAVSMQPASAAGNAPLSEVLLADGVPAFDSNGKDYDIVTNAAVTVLGADASSPISILTQGDKRATVFLPQDRAFIALVEKVTGTKPASEEEAFNTLSTLGVPIIERVLLYHATLKTYSAKKLLNLKGKKRNIKSAEGTKFKVVRKKKKLYIKDKSSETKDAKVVKKNINKGNKQLAHGIDQVLIPTKMILDLAG